MVYECERCGCKSISTRTFRYCVACEYKLNELGKTWDDTIDDLMVELKEAACKMFNTLDDDLAYAKRINTITILERAFKKIRLYDYYDKQLCDIYGEVVEPTNQEIADREDDMMASYWERKVKKVAK